MLGVFILWMGWFGFNAGSTTGVTGGEGALFGGAGKSFALIAVNTNLAAASGALSAMLVSWRVVGKPDVGIAWPSSASAHHSSSRIRKARPARSRWSASWLKWNWCTKSRSRWAPRSAG
jgi:hypothetical protein